MTGAISRHPVFTYYVVAFAISWGGVLVLVGGPSTLVSASSADSAAFMTGLFATLSGPPIAGVLLTALVEGREG